MSTDPQILVASQTAPLGRRLTVGVIVTTLLMLVLVTGVITHAAVRGFEEEIRPQIGREATAIGTSLATQIGRAVFLGIPPAKLVGVEEYLRQALDNHPALDRIRLDLSGGAVHEVSRSQGVSGLTDVAVPVLAGSSAIGVLHLGVNPSQSARAAADTLWDIGIVLLVSLLMTVEILIFLTDRHVSLPLRLVERMQARFAVADWTTREAPRGLDDAGRYLRLLAAAARQVNERRQQVLWLAQEVAAAAPALRDEAMRIVDRWRSGAGFAPNGLAVAPLPTSPAVARAPLILYVLAEQLSTSFIPIFAKSLQGGGLLPASIALGLPITAFAGTIGLLSPYGARLVEWTGARWAVAIGCVPAMIGYLLAAQAESLTAFTAWRALTGVGYALITIACQSYLVAAAGQRGRNMATFVTAVMTGALCGTAIGAVLADRIGYRGTFVVSAVLTLLAGLLTLAAMDAATGRHARPASRTPQGRRPVLSHRPFLALVAFAAVPAKLVLTGFVFFISPLALAALGDSQPEIGRQVMLYAGTMLLTIRVGAWLADRAGAARQAIGLAGLVTGLGLLLVLVLPAGVALPVAIAAVGLAQGLASAPMLAVVPELWQAGTEQPRLADLYGFLRAGERAGSIVGPILAGIMVASMGYMPAAATFGAISLAATAVYWVLTRRRAS